MAVGECFDLVELERLLPFHATGTLNKRDAGCVERGLAALPQLTMRFLQIQHERNEIACLSDGLGYPSARPLTRLLGAVAGSCASKRRTTADETVACRPFGSGCVSAD